MFSIDTDEKLITVLPLNDSEIESITFNKAPVQIMLKTFKSLDDLRSFCEGYNMTIDYGFLN